MADLASLISTAVSIKGMMAAPKEDEALQTFVDLGGQEDEEDKGEIGRGATKKKDHKRKRGDHKKGGKDKKQAGEKKSAPSEKKPETEKQTEVDPNKPPSPRIPAGKSTFAQISKELKARKQAQIAAQAKARRGKKTGGRRQEEIYTDKDRAAAVNLGTRDIKQSLKIKKRQDRSHALQIPEEAEPGTLLALGNNELRSGDVKIALGFVNKALELNPSDKNSLVARSKCYLLLGEPQLALQDAETAIQGDKNFVRAIYQKAEALYHLGDFEHSLMYYHRGHRLRPELEIFRLGVQKAQEAIENTIGSAPGLNEAAPTRTESTPRDSISTSKLGETGRSDKSSTNRTGSGCETKRSTSKASDSKRGSIRSRSAAPLGRRGSKSLLGELGVDRVYLENLLKHPDIKSSNPDATNIIIAQAEEGIAFLKSRQEFWRQQRPNATPSSKKSTPTNKTPPSAWND